jgi:signal peptidase
VIAFIVLVAILLIVSAFPIPGNYKVMVVKSGSMEPTIKTGSIVVVKPASDYKIGDIITFGPYSKTKAPTTHRIYEMKVEGGEPIYITKGDANNAPDTREIKKIDIVGKVLFSVPFVGYAVDFAKKPLGFALIIIIPAAIIIYDEIRKIFGEIKKKKQNA